MTPAASVRDLRYRTSRLFFCCLTRRTSSCPGTAGPWAVTTKPNNATLVFVVGPLANGLHPIVVDASLAKPRK